MPGRAVVGRAGCERSRVERVDRRAVGGAERDVRRAGDRLAAGDPEVRVAVGRDEADLLAVLDRLRVAEGRERRLVERARRGEVADVHSDVVDHGVSFLTRARWSK